MRKKTKLIIIASVAVGAVISLCLSLLLFVVAPKSVLTMKLFGLQTPSADEAAFRYTTTTKVMSGNSVISEQSIEFEYEKTADGYDFRIEDQTQNILVSGGVLYDNSAKRKRAVSVKEQNELRDKILKTAGIGSGVLAFDEMFSLLDVKREDYSETTEIKLFFSDAYFSKLIDNDLFSFNGNSDRPVVMTFKDNKLSSMAFDVVYSYEIAYDGEKHIQYGKICSVSAFDYSSSVAATAEQRRYFDFEIETKNVFKTRSVQSDDIYDFAFSADKIIEWNVGTAKVFNLEDGDFYDSFKFGCFPSGYACTEKQFAIYSRNDDRKAVLYDVAKKTAVTYATEVNIAGCGFTGECFVVYLNNGKTRVYGAEGVREFQSPNDKICFEFVYNCYLKKCYLVPCSTIATDDLHIYEISDAPVMRSVTDFNPQVLGRRIFSRRNGFIVQGENVLYDDNFRPVKRFSDEIMCGDAFLVEETEQYIVTSECVYNKTTSELYRHGVNFSLYDAFRSYDGKLFCKTSYSDIYLVAFGGENDMDIDSAR